MAGLVRPRTVSRVEKTSIDYMIISGHEEGMVIRFFTRRPLILVKDRWPKLGYRYRSVLVCFACPVPWLPIPPRYQGRDQTTLVGECNAEVAAAMHVFRETSSDRQRSQESTVHYSPYAAALLSWTLEKARGLW